MIFVGVEGIGELPEGIASPSARNSGKGPLHTTPPINPF
jgi:hypothetical protein